MAVVAGWCACVRVVAAELNRRCCSWIVRVSASVIKHWSRSYAENSKTLQKMGEFWSSIAFRVSIICCWVREWRIGSTFASDVCHLCSFIPRQMVSAGISADIKVIKFYAAHGGAGTAVATPNYVYIIYLVTVTPTDFFENGILTWAQKTQSKNLFNSMSVRDFLLNI